MALSLGKYGIRVNAICPGFTDTPHLRRWMAGLEHPSSAEAEINGLHALGEIVQPSDIGKLAVYLASDDSSKMTGADLILDGGLSARLYNSDHV
jgi:NAD(P)-dependent dehydrogenase (short-subunit alcohol dehydrogenase family)